MKLNDLSVFTNASPLRFKPSKNLARFGCKYDSSNTLVLFSVKNANSSSLDTSGNKSILILYGLLKHDRGKVF